MQPGKTIDYPSIIDQLQQENNLLREINAKQEQTIKDQQKLIETQQVSLQNQQTMLESQQQLLEQQGELNKKLVQANERLQGHIDKLNKSVFGSKSERYLGPEQIPGQLRMDLMGELNVEVGPHQAAKAGLDKKGQTPSDSQSKEKKKHFCIPEHLVDEVVELYPDEIPEGSIPAGSEETLRLKCTLQRLSAIKYIRYKFLLPTPEGDPGLKSKIIIAPFPDEIIKDCFADPTLMATLVIEKFEDHIPAHRQMKRFEREGIKLAHSTMLDWIAKVCMMLLILYEALKLEVLDSKYLMMDETPIKVLDKDKKGTTHKGYFWVTQAPLKGLVFFEYQQGRDKQIPQTILKGFKGYLQTDGYSCYSAIVKDSQITHLCCLAHSRRYFNESMKNDPKRAGYAMEIYRQLYAIEEQIKDESAEVRLKARQQQAKPIWEDFGRWLEDNAGLLNPGSAIHKAFMYTMNRYKRLSAYMEDPELNIDSNPIERSIRPVALGKHNWLFAGSHEAAQRSAMIYSFTGTCKMQGVNPLIWLIDVIKRIKNHPPEKIHELLPHHWKKIREEAEAEKQQKQEEVAA